MRIWWLACNKNPARFLNDASFRYRALNPCLAFKNIGWSCEFAHRKSPPDGPLPEAVVFHRPSDSWSFRWQFSRFAKKQTRLVADVDDLIFDPQLAEFSPGVLNGLNSLRFTQKLFAANFRALSRFEYLSVSTEPLARHAQRLFPSAKIVVVPNSIPLEWEDPPLETRNDASPVLGYFPGTRSHDRDFAMIRQPIESFLNKHPDWKLFVAGPLQFSIGISPERVLTHERVDFRAYPQLLRRASMILAPLEPNTFNSCKSGIKFLEAGLLGIPSIGSQIQDAERFSGPGVSLISSSSSWEDELEKTRELSTSSPALAEVLRKRVMENADPLQAARKFEELFQ